jgi:hypothetical protein
VDESERSLRQFVDQSPVPGTLISDGDRIGDLDLINTGLMTPNGFFQLQHTNATPASKTAVFLAADLHTTMASIGTQHFGIVCLDGPNACILAMKLLRAYPVCGHLLDQRCATHGCARGVIRMLKVEVFKEMYESVMEIVAFVLKFPKIGYPMFQYGYTALFRPASGYSALWRVSRRKSLEYR